MLLASEGRAFAAPVIARAAELAQASGAAVSVLAIARIWGSGFGFPNPWLMPSRHELEAQRAQVAAAIAALGADIPVAGGRVVGTRNAAGRILAEAKALGSAAIVMGADPPPRWRLLGELWWSHEPYRVQRRLPGRVHLVRAG